MGCKAILPGDPPTERQRAVLDFMRSYQREHGIPPTLQACMDRFGYRHANAVVSHIHALEKRGLVRKAHGPSGSRGSGHYVPVVPPGCCSACGQRVPEVSSAN